MNKRSLARIAVAALFISAPLISSAQGTSAQDQINALLAQIKSLQLQVQNLIQIQATSSTAITPSDVVSASPYRICNLISRNLSQGASGDDVVSLQEFLSSNGYFSASATGYYGPLTAQAVAKWQASEGVSAVGAVGPLSRAALGRRCGGRDFHASPMSGNAPLTVSFWYVLGGNGSDGYSIDFGDGSSETPTIGCGTNPNSLVMACPRALVANHTYASDGTYTATLTQSNDVCHGIPGCMAPTFMKVVGKVQIVVGGQTQCRPINYMPVLCSDGSAPQPKHNEAGCIIGYECPVANYTPPANCKVWNDGCNTCSRQTPDSAPMCTMRACLAGQGFAAGKGYCQIYFDSTTNKPPVISGFSGPTTLSVNQQGTWNVNASDPENGTLSYSIRWGDEVQTPYAIAGGAAMVPVVQQTTFTHSYANAGNYTVKITVTDSAGQTASASASVQVGGSTVCTTEYAPVCGQPPEPACRHSIPACMIATPGPTTYSNRCQMNAAGASFLYEGACTTMITACTQDAMQCPDGTWVGRTGPSCQFVCPTTAAASTTSTSSTSCTTPWGTTVPSGQSATGFCPDYPNGLVGMGFCGLTKTCQNGQWISPTATPKSPCVTSTGESGVICGVGPTNTCVGPSSVYYQQCVATGQTPTL